MFNFEGEPKLIQVDFDRFTKHKKNIYDTEWKFLNISINYPNAPDHPIDKPQALDEMLALARKLSKGIHFLRTDFYCIGDKLYFGELTFYPGSGIMWFDPEEYNDKLGEMILLYYIKPVLSQKGSI